MKWVVASPYFETADDRWIHDSITDDRHSFVLIPRLGEDRNWHYSSARADAREWLQRMQQARQAYAYDDSGIITVFPQLAAATGLLKLAARSDRPLVAWLFNTEGLSGSIRRTVARLPLSVVDRFVVHSTREIEGYSKLLGLPIDRFEFVPLQYGGKIETERPQGQDDPYVFATGSGYRDYETFFEAVAMTGHRTLVLASNRILSGLTVPPNVEILDQLPRPEIRRLVRHARVNVVPLSDEALTGGLVTIVETLRHGRAMVITDRRGVEDYVFDGKNALCPPLYDADAMADAISTMWNDDALRAELDANAIRFADDNCTDEAAGRGLIRILDGVCS